MGINESVQQKAKEKDGDSGENTIEKCNDIKLPDQPDKNIVIAEYSAVRNEILQLNMQIFSLFSSGLGLNFLILGWMFTKEEPGKLWYSPLIGIALLFTVNILLLNIGRLTHRLAYFQKYFIEERVPDICWARVYLKYRDLSPKRFINVLYERIVENKVYLNIFVQFFNLVIVLRYIRYWKYFWGPYTVYIFTIPITLFLIFQLVIEKSMINYESIIEDIFKEIKES